MRSLYFKSNEQAGTVFAADFLAVFQQDTLRYHGSTMKLFPAARVHMKLLGVLPRTFVNFRVVNRIKVAAFFFSWNTKRLPKELAGSWLASINSIKMALQCDWSCWCYTGSDNQAEVLCKNIDLRVYLFSSLHHRTRRELHALFAQDSRWYICMHNRFFEFCAIHFL